MKKHLLSPKFQTLVSFTRHHMQCAHNCYFDQGGIRFKIFSVLKLIFHYTEKRQKADRKHIKAFRSSNNNKNIKNFILLILYYFE